MKNKYLNKLNDKKLNEIITHYKTNIKPNPNFRSPAWLGEPAERLIFAYQQDQEKFRSEIDLDYKETTDIHDPLSPKYDQTKSELFKNYNDLYKTEGFEKYVTNAYSINVIDKEIETSERNFQTYKRDWECWSMFDTGMAEKRNWFQKIFPIFRSRLDKDNARDLRRAEIKAQKEFFYIKKLNDTKTHMLKRQSEFEAKNQDKLDKVVELHTIFDNERKVELAAYENEQYQRRLQEDRKAWAIVLATRAAAQAASKPEEGSTPAIEDPKPEAPKLEVTPVVALL